MLEFKNFHAAQRKLAGIEIMTMIKKRSDADQNERESVSAELFYSLAV
jgi:hypothetical protein